MTDADPREMAKAVVLEGLQHDTPLFVAMQYVGLIDQRDLEQLFGDALRPEVVEVAVPQEVVWPVADNDVGPPPMRGTVRRIRVMERPLVPPTIAQRERRAAPPMTEKRRLFIDWMERRIPDDDPRVRAAFLTATGGE